MYNSSYKIYIFSVSHSNGSTDSLEHTRSEGNVTDAKGKTLVDCESSHVLSQGHLFNHILKPKKGFSDVLT